MVRIARLKLFLTVLLAVGILLNSSYCTLMNLDEEHIDIERSIDCPTEDDPCKSSSYNKELHKSIKRALRLYHNLFVGTVSVRVDCYTWHQNSLTYPFFEVKARPVIYLHNEHGWAFKYSEDQIGTAYLSLNEHPLYGYDVVKGDTQRFRTKRKFRKLLEEEILRHCE